MIPIRLQVRNFMSYGDPGASLDFTAFRVACLCGDNGHGKSALLDAITWALWGRTRAGGRGDRDVIRIGAPAASVELEFLVPDGQREHRYRVLRERPRNGTASVELQVHDGESYRPLTGTGIADTQNKIEKLLRLDYDTFINSAYIMQGRADEFMRKRPGDRKELLVGLLGLSIYDDLARRAREKAAGHERDAAETTRLIAAIDAELSEEQPLRSDAERLGALVASTAEQLATFDAAARALRERLAGLAARAQEAAGVRARLTQLHDERRELEIQRARAGSALVACRATLARARDIRARQAQLAKLRAEEAALASASSALHVLNQRRAAEAATIERERQALALGLATLRQQVRRCEQEALTGDASKRRRQLEEALLACRLCLSRGDDIRARVRRLAALQEEDRALAEAARQLAELGGRRATALGRIELGRGQLAANLDAVRRQALGSQQAAASAAAAGETIRALDIELARLDGLAADREASARERESLGATVAGKQADNVRLRDEMNAIKERMDYLRRNEREALCPVCRTPLDEAGKRRLLADFELEGKARAATYRATQAEIVGLEAKIRQSTLRIDSAAKDLRGRDATAARLTQARTSLEQAGSAAAEASRLGDEIASLAMRLRAEDFAHEARAALATADDAIAALGYDADRHREVSIQMGELSNAPRELAVLDRAESDEPDLVAALAPLNRQAETDAAETARLSLEADSIERRVDSGDFAHDARTRHSELESEIAGLGYDGARHEGVRAGIQLLSAVEQQAAELTRAESDEPELARQASALAERVARNGQWTDEERLRLDQIEGELAVRPEVERQAQRAEGSRDECALRLGRAREDRAATHQRLRGLDVRRRERVERKAQLDAANLEAELHRQLEAALGKNGIQAAIIEAVLPELEEDANGILSAMTNGLMAVKIETERAARADDHTISTLDIQVADELGTRPIEMYSGGESFRINFAIRIALSKLLARRAGGQIRTLVVDEGFGSLDSVGRQRLVEAINAVAEDFDKILVVTHIDELKDAFPTRIDVYKDAELGSRIEVSHA